MNISPSGTGEKPYLIFVITNLEAGGAERVFFHLTEYMCAFARIQVVLFEESGHYLELIKSLPDVEVRVFPKSNGHIPLLKNLRAYFRREKPLRVLSFMEYPNMLVSSALIGTGIPHVSSERTDYMSYFSRSVKDLVKIQLLKAVFRAAEQVVVVSAGLRESLIQDFKAKPEKVRLIRNGIDFEKLDIQAAQEISGPFVPDRYTFLAAGRLVREKNYPLMIKAFAQVLSEIPQAKLCILGEGVLKESLIILAENLGIRDKIFFAGFEPNPAAYIKQAGVFVLSSDLEGMPNALIEALYLNGHLVSTDCRTGPSEVILHEKTGLLVPVRDVNQLALAMIRMCRDEDLRASCYVASRQHAREFDIQIAWQKWKEVLLKSTGKTV